MRGWRRLEAILIRLRRSPFELSRQQGEGWGEGWVLASPFRSLAVIPAQAGIQFLSWSVVASSLLARLPLTQRAFRSSADARVTFLLLAQKKSNPKKMALRAKARGAGMNTSADDQRLRGGSRDLPPTQRLPRDAAVAKRT